MALLELRGYGVGRGAARVAGIDLSVEPGTMLAVVGRGDGAVSLLALALAGLLPTGATSDGTLNFAGKRVLYLDREADASAVVAGPELIVADEPGRGRDPATQFALLTALQQASQTAAVIIFTADFRLALSMGLEVAVVANGKLLVKAPASQIAELPQYDTVRHLVGGARLRTRTLMRPPIGEPVLELDGVSKAYRPGLPKLGPPPVSALAEVGFAVRQGEVVGVLGPGGAGKSTLLRLIASLEAPSAGHIGRRPGLVSYVFSDPRRAFNPTLPVGVSLTEPLRVEQTLLVEEQADRLVEVVRAVGLEPELLTRLPGEFGVADLQRMGLARALAGRPNLLLMDDPTRFLDPAELREFLVLFARVRADFGLTAIVASREFEVLRSVADRLLVLEGGRIVEGGKPVELSEAPQQDVTRRLVVTRYPGRFVAPVVAEPVPATDRVAMAAAAVTLSNDVPSDAVTEVPTAALPLEGPHAPNATGAPEVAKDAVGKVVPVDAPSTTLSGGPTPPLHGGGAPADSVVEPPSDDRAIGSALTIDADSAGLAAAEPEPVHGLSAAIVIAPVVLAEVEVAPVIVPPELVSEPQSTLPSEPPAAPDPTVSEQAAVGPAPEPVVSSADAADEAAEGGEAEGAVGGLVDAAGGAEAADDKAGR